MSKAPTEFIIFEQRLEEKADEAKEAAKAAQRERFKHKLQNEYDEWSFIRDYVRRHMHLLKGQKLPIEISSIQDISDPYNCVILNDIEMLPYLAIYDEIKMIEAQMERLERNKKLEQKICPKCEGEVESKPNMFHWRGNSFAGLVCKDCTSLWDYDDSFVKFTAAHSKLEKENRT